MNNILLHGYYGYNNLGDDLLFCEMMKHIPQKYEIFVNVPREYAPNMEQFRHLRKFSMVHGRKETLRRCYSMLIFGGGGLFPYRKYTYRNLLYWLSLTATCRKKVFCGIGIVPKPGSTAFPWLLRCLSWCSVRDNTSLEYIRRYRHQVVNCGDLYFGNDSHYVDHSTERKCIVSVAYPFYADEIIHPEVKRRYKLLVSDIAKAVAYIKELGYEVNYLPFAIGRDEPMIADIQKELGSDDKVLKRGADYTLDNVDKLFGGYNLALSMRFHSILLAVKNAVPVIPISYDYKSEELLKEAGLVELSTRYGIAENRCFGEILDLDTDNLKRVIEYVIDNGGTIMQKEIEFFQKKYLQVIQNYQNIFGPGANGA